MCDCVCAHTAQYLQLGRAFAPILREFRTPIHFTVLDVLEKGIARPIWLNLRGWADGRACTAVTVGA